ncbi:MAG TPA: hypothetical protein VET30_07560 [Pseudoxanthomonas sp.]|nr:hypothetical protein [Pseudoxanthomonas sp.]
MRILLATGLMLACGSASAATARCHVIYGGENWTVDATPTDKPYLVEGKKIGRYFEFKLAYVDLPATGAAIKVYTYTTISGESVLVHQSTHQPPFDSRSEPFGFTGFNYVYEPSKGSELQYWCEYIE